MPRDYYTVRRQELARRSRERSARRWAQLKRFFWRCPFGFGGDR